MNKDEYKALYESEARIDLTDDDIRTWLDRIIDAFIARYECDYRLAYGERDSRGRFDHVIETCLSENKELHIYRGIELLAKATGNDLVLEDNEDDKYPWRYSIIYRGIKVFQIESKKLTTEAE